MKRPYFFELIPSQCLGSRTRQQDRAFGILLHVTGQNFFLLAQWLRRRETGRAWERLRSRPWVKRDGRVICRWSRAYSTRPTIAGLPAQFWCCDVRRSICNRRSALSVPTSGQGHDERTGCQRSGYDPAPPRSLRSLLPARLAGSPAYALLTPPAAQPLHTLPARRRVRDRAISRLLRATRDPLVCSCCHISPALT